MSQPHDQLQFIPAISPKEAETAERLARLLDSIVALDDNATLRLFADQYAPGFAERVLTAWAAARGIELRDDSVTYGDGRVLRTLNVDLPHGGLIALQWPMTSLISRVPTQPEVLVPLVKTDAVGAGHSLRALAAQQYPNAETAEVLDRVGTAMVEAAHRAAIGARS